MACQPPRVFISYSHDSIQHKDMVLRFAERLRKDGIDAQIDQYVGGRPPGGWPRWMLDKLEWAGFVLLICTENYYRRFRGHEEPNKGKGVDWEGQLITLEIYHATGRTAKFVPVIFGSQNERFVPEPLRDHPYRLDSEDSYHELHDLLTGQAGVPLPELGVVKTVPRNAVEPLRFGSSKTARGSMGKIHGVPELPPHYLPREKDITGLKRKLLAGIRSVVVTGQGQAVGVQGMGGIGKTVLAAALGHDSEVRQAFPDGIYWLTVGQKPDLLDLQNRLLRQLTGSKEILTTVQEAKDALREVLEGRSALVVVDDAWTIDDADAFFVIAPPAGLLITTRNNEVLVGLGANEHRLDVLSQADALKMLAEWVGEKTLDKLPVEAGEVAKECGCLPLALAMIGAMIRLRPTGWKDALGRLQRADLEAVRRNFPGYPYADLLRAIEVSIDALEPDDQERYLDLAVFPEDQLIPEGTLPILWKLDESETRDCTARLVARSLAMLATDGTSLILHDLQRDLIRKRHEKNVPGSHLRLVEAWDALPKLPDTYAWRWIGYHMVKAGRKDALLRLLLDFDYLQTKLAATDVNTLISDYDFFADGAELRLIQSAMRLSANILVRDQRQLASQLTGRLVDSTNTIIEALLTQALEKAPRPWLRPIQANLTPPGGPLTRTLEGHTDAVRAVTLMADGCGAVSGSVDRTLRVWHLDSGELLRTLEGHRGGVNAVAVTPDGRHVVSGSDDRTLRLWDLGSGQTLRSFEGHSRSVNGVAITPDGRRMVSASHDKTLRVWDLRSGEPMCTLEGHKSWVSVVAVTPDGRRAVSGSDDGTLRVWDLESAQLLCTLDGHTNTVRAVAITPDGRRAVSSSDDQTLRVWDLESGETLRTLEGHTNTVRSVAVMPDGRHAVSGSNDHTLRLWNLESGQLLRTLEGHTNWVCAVVVTPDGRHAVSGSNDQTLRLWDLESAIVRSLVGHLDSVSVVAVAADGSLAVSGSDDGTLRLWDLGTGQTLRTLKGQMSLVRAVTVTLDGHRAVSDSWDRTLQLWELESDQTPRTLEGPIPEPFDAVAVTPDGRRAVSASHDGTLRLWDLESGQILRTLQGHTRRVSAMAVTADGRRAVSASEDRTLRVWDMDSGQSLCTLQDHNMRSVSAVAVTPDGRRAISASEDRTLRVWDLDSGQTVRTLEGHTNTVRAVAVTPDGRRVVSGSEDRILRVWDLDSGQTVRTLEGHTGWIRAVAVTPDGHRAVSGSSDRTLRLWNLDSGEHIATFTGEGSMCCCAVAPAGHTIVSGDALGRVHFLRLIEADKTKSSIGESKILLLHRKEH